MARTIFMCGLALILGLICGGPGYATVTTLQDGLNSYTGTRDTYIEKENPDADFGNSSSLYVREQTNTHQRSLLYFDITSLLPSISSVTTATLSSYQNTGNKAATITPYMIIAGSWYEGDGTGTNAHADWNHRVHNTTTWGTGAVGDLAASDYSTAGVSPSLNGQWNEWVVSSIVSYWVSNPSNNYGFYLWTGDSSNRSFASSESGTQGERPKLTIDYIPTGTNPDPYIPEPASAALFTIGILGLIRRKIKTGIKNMGGSMKKLLLVLGLIGLLAGNAWAVPSINGLVGVGEWDFSSLIIYATDPNEAGAGDANIPDKYDIRYIYGIQDTGGGTDGGLYLRIDTYDTPSAIGYDGAGYPVKLKFNFDYDGDNIDDDKIIVNELNGLEVRYWNGATWATSANGSAAVNNVWEIFIPDEDLNSGALPLNNNFGGILQLDNNGRPADDYIPDEGRFTTVPEPTSMSLLGLGLLGAIAAFRRRK